MIRGFLLRSQVFKNPETGATWRRVVRNCQRIRRDLFNTLGIDALDREETDIIKQLAQEAEEFAAQVGTDIESEAEDEDEELF